MIIKNIYTA